MEAIRQKKEHRMEEGSPQDLRGAARKAIESGRMPSRQPERTWGGPGNGTRCAVCGIAICRDQLGFEVEFATPSRPLEVGSYHLHLGCYHAWEALIGDGEIAAANRGLKGKNTDPNIVPDGRQGRRTEETG
jgi:hypothetical protein